MSRMADLVIQIVEMKEDGKTEFYIANVLGIDVETVREAIEMYGDMLSDTEIGEDING